MQLFTSTAHMLLLGMNGYLALAVGGTVYHARLCRRSCVLECLMLWGCFRTSPNSAGLGGIRVPAALCSSPTLQYSCTQPLRNTLLQCYSATILCGAAPQHYRAALLCSTLQLFAGMLLCAASPQHLSAMLLCSTSLPCFAAALLCNNSTQCFGFCEEFACSWSFAGRKAAGSPERRPTVQ